MQTYLLIAVIGALMGYLARVSYLRKMEAVHRVEMLRLWEPKARREFVKGPALPVTKRR